MAGGLHLYNRMSFSVRQQHCLEAMGMVPWVSTVLPAEPLFTEPLAGTQVPTAPLLAEQPHAELPVDAPAAVPADIPAARASEMPTDLPSLSTWLPYQPLVSFLASGHRRHVMGRDDASLVVVVETGSGVGSHPLEGDAARLFDMMMRAIKLTRQQLRICALAGDGVGSTTASEYAAEQPAQVTLSDICNPQTKAVLLLVQRWDTSDDRVTSQDDTVRLAAPPCPVWHIPHPDILLSRNQLKRQAWQSLQALQRVL